MNLARTRAILACAVALGATVFLLGGRAPAARANSSMASIMMDDNLLVYRNDATRNAALAEMRQLGVDYVRVTVLWSNVALGMKQYDAKHHIAFNEANPYAYPPHNWDRYDRLVQSASKEGIGIYFDVTGPGPSYTHGVAPHAVAADGPGVAATWMPSPQQFYEFVTAVGKRYSGTERATNGQMIPRVSLWSLWNEPNQGGWITPQWYTVHGQVIDYSAVLYRELYLYGRQALELTGHGGDRILIGETSPLGVTRKTMTSEIDPTTFIRELMCAGPTDQPYTSEAAAIRDCSIFNKFGGSFLASGWAHHPYTKYDAPQQVDSDPNAITVANIQALPNLLDALAASTHRIASGLPIIASEDGYQTNPPNKYSGIPVAEQGPYINLDDYLLWSNPRVYGNTQFLLRDSPPDTAFPKGSRGYYSTYDSGLEFYDGAPKPALADYAMPLVAFPTTASAAGAKQIQVWGQLRFLGHQPLGAYVNTVYLQYEATGSSTWATVAAIRVTDTVRHYFDVTEPDPGAGSIRLYYYGYKQIPNRLSRPVALAG